MSLASVSRHALTSFVLFQVVWLCCAFGAANGSSAPGIAAACGLSILHVSTASRRRDAILMLIACGVIGFLCESALVASGLVVYAAPWPLMAVAPAWIVALWVAFGCTLAPIGRMLAERFVVPAIVLGAVAAPLSYLAGERAGALAFTEPAFTGWIAVSIVWGVAFPILIAAQRRLV